MAGVIGVGPVYGSVLTVDNGTHGGNLDVQKVTGSTVMLRVEHPGAHFFIGDCRALQGEGEAVGMGAIEIGANVTLRMSLEPAPARLAQPRIQTATHICMLGYARPLEDVMRIAFAEMIYWLKDGWNISEPRAPAAGPDRGSALHPGGEPEIHLHLQGAEDDPLRLHLKWMAGASPALGARANQWQAIIS